MYSLLVIVAATAVGLAVGWFGWMVLAIFVGLILFVWLTSRPKLMVLMLVALIAAGQFGRIPPGSASGTLLLTDILAGLLFLVWYVWALSRAQASYGENPRRTLPAALIAWIGFLGIALVSLVLSPLHLGKSELATNGFYLVRLVCYSALAWIIPATFAGNKSSATLVRWLIGTVAAVTLLGFVQLYLLPDIGVLARYGWDPHVGRLVSSFLDPNYLGGFFAVGIALIGISLTMVTSRRSVAALVTLLAVLLAATVLTFSRSGYLAVGIVVLVLGLRYSWRLLLLAVICIVPLALSIPRVAQRVEGGFSVDKTAQDRIDSWTIASSIIQDYPVTGIGYNNYRSAQEQLGLLGVNSTSRSGAGSDSSLLNVFATTGLFGLILFLVAAFLIIRQAFSLVQGSPLRPKEWGRRLPVIAGLTLLVSIPALAVHSWFVNAIFYPFILLLLAALVGALYLGGPSARPPE